MNSVLKAVENGDVDGALVDKLTAARLDVLSDPSSTLVVKDVIPKLSTYGIFLTGDAIKLHKKFRQYLQNNAEFVTGQIENYTQPLKVSIGYIYHHHHGHQHYTIFTHLHHRHHHHNPDHHRITTTIIITTNLLSSLTIVTTNRFIVVISISACSITTIITITSP